MAKAGSIRAALERLLSGGGPAADHALVREALEAGTIEVARGERSLALGGSADGAVVVSGDGNVVIRIEAAAAAGLLGLLDGVHGDRRHQLPADVADFQGREAQIERLMALLAAEPGRAVITALDGMGGLGKSALAVHVGHRLKARYPDGQLFVDLAGTGAAPLDPAQAMARVLRSLAPSAALPDAADELAPLYRSALDGRRVLLILDNAADGGQVAPLLPPSSCAMIVTSRRRVALAGAARVDLDLLAPPEARALLRAIVGPAPGDATLDRIAGLCGCLPLALRVAGSFLTVNRLWSAEEYAAALSDQRERLGRLALADHPQLNVLASMALSLRALVTTEPGAAGPWHRLAVFAADFALDAAVAVWGVQPAEARDRMQALVDRAMVLFDTAAARFRLHDLMRDLAAGRVPAGSDVPLSADLSEQLATAGRRHAGHYRQVLAQADELYLDGGDGVLAGLALFDRERPNIEAGHAWAVAHRQADEGAAALCVDYPAAGAYVLSLRQPAGDRIRWLDEAVGAARRIGNRRGEGAALGNLGIAHTALGDARRALDFHEQHLKIVREIGDRQGEGIALGNLGQAHADLGDARQAIKFYEQHLRVAREIKDRRGESNALGSLGIAHAALGDARRALDFHEQYLKIAREIGDRQGEGNALGNMGIAYRSLGDTGRAIGFYEQQLTIVREIGDRRGEGAALGNLGVAHAALGDARRAIEFYEQGLTIAREIGNRRAEGNALGNLGNAHAALGDVPQAIEILTAARAIFAEIRADHLVEIADQSIVKLEINIENRGYKCQKH